MSEEIKLLQVTHENLQPVGFWPADPGDPWEKIFVDPGNLGVHPCSALVEIGVIGGWLAENRCGWGYCTLVHLNNKN